MIKGRGMLAKAFASFNEQENIIIFAQGVSNSQEKDEDNFKRESNILQSVLDENKGKLIVYFGTCSVDDPESKNTPYVEHKLNMEKLIQESGLDYYIFRLPQVVGKATSPTLINFIATQIKAEKEFNVWGNSTRNLIDVDDVCNLVSYIVTNNLDKNSIINVASNRTVAIVTIVMKMESIIGKKASYKVLDKGASYSIDISSIKPYLNCCDVDFNNDYMDRLLMKYCG